MSESERGHTQSSAKSLPFFLMLAPKRRAMKMEARTIKAIPTAKKVSRLIDPSPDSSIDGML